MGYVGRGDRPQVPDRGDLPGMASRVPPRLDDYIMLMKRCWAQDPADRPGLQEVIQTLRWALRRPPPFCHPFANDAAADRSA